MNDAINAPQANNIKHGHNYINRIVPIIFLLIILFFGAWVRFDGITEQGIRPGYDAVRYIKEAKLWAAGQPPEFLNGKYYRPAAYFLMGMAIKIFGYNDYSIKMMNGILDMLSILLIFMIASILAKNLWVGAASSLIYAFLPEVFRLVRWEMVQVESTFFVLLTLFFFILFASRQKTRDSVTLFLLFMSGLSSGLAANTHTDLAFLAPGYVLYLFISSYNSQSKRKFLKEFLILAFIFTFSFFTPYLLGFFLFGTEKVIQVFFNELSIVKKSLTPHLAHASKPFTFFNILYLLFKFYFGKQFFITGMLLIGTIFIIIYRKIKKESDPLWIYLPLILMFSYAFFYSLFHINIREDFIRILMPLLPLIIFIITIWYYKIFKQLFDKYSLIVFVCFFLILFLLNPKALPGKKKYYSLYRITYNILKDDVNPENKLLIAPVTIYSFDCGFQSDLYFGNNAIYMADLPLKNKYNLKSLKELLKDMNVRYIFLGNKIHHKLLKFKGAFPSMKNYHGWLRNENFPYSLEKDLEIIQAYIQSKGGLVIHKSGVGKIYYLTSGEIKPGLIPNGSFEHWWKGLPLGEWELVSGRISRSREAFTDGLSSIRLEPGDKKGTRLRWVFREPLSKGKDNVKVRVRLDVKAGESNRFFVVFNAYVNKKWKKLGPGIIWYTGKGEWVTISGDFTITPDMKYLNFNLYLRGAREPAFVDNLSIIVTDK